MDYPKVRVRLDGPKVEADVDIAPKPEPDNLVTVNEADPAPPQASNNQLPSWLLDAG
jgi:hypothetical protein